jgi:hypothetical protein
MVKRSPEIDAMREVHQAVASMRDRMVVSGASTLECRGVDKALDLIAVLIIDRTGTSTRPGKPHDCG